ncbi:MAG: type IV toxin-antitoxin system AbiEi family antitoxin [Bacteroidales bacterium]|nr:type IV toxin-antitoxin system AbiEi family antitoxin [Bacteroidales bacterium]
MKHNLFANITEKHVSLQTNYLHNMDKDSLYKIKDWIDDLQKRGRITFSRQEVITNFPLLSEQAVRNALNRLTAKNSIVSVWKGFYVIVSLKYALRQIVPPELYIDDLMQFLNRPYYVGLLNAAAFYGAAHQQPQQTSVISIYPPLRGTTKKDARINFNITRKQIPHGWLKSFKTENGTVQVSSPELTAADLITFQKDVGGLNRISTVLNELAESLDFNKLDNIFFEYIPISTIQRLGYLLEKPLEQEDLANKLYEKFQKFNCKFQKIPLKYSKKTADCETDTKWKIIINEYVEIDE